MSEWAALVTGVILGGFAVLALAMKIFGPSIRNLQGHWWRDEPDGGDGPDDE